MRRALVSALALALVSCGGSGPTEVVLVVDTDLVIPDEIDRIEISLSGSSGTPTNVVADLTDPGTPDLPLTLTTFSTLGSGDLAITVIGRLMGAEVTRWEARTSFVGGETRMLRAILAARCLAITCDPGQTCDEAGCRAVAIASDALPEWPGAAPILEGPACTPSDEQCNLYDDDCDEMIDEGIDVSSDAANCGECGRACSGSESCGGGYCDSERASVLSVGGAHACVVRQSGNVSCWGWNAYGQLGDGGFLDRPFPADVPGVIGATDVSASVAHTCVVAGGEVYCWGDNGRGELGDGTTEPRVAPTAIGLSGASAVSAGVSHTCALTMAGDVACWGGNGRGQVGNGTTDPVLAPQMVIVGDPVVSVATGNVHTCAAYMDGRVACWGANGGGQLGIGMAGDDQTLPQMVPGVANAVEVVAGRGHTCARSGDGSVFCWGVNDRGQVGNGSMMATPAPAMISAMSAVGLGTGSASSHTCASTADGASCWGSNAQGQLGDGTTMNAASPVDMMLLETGPAHVATGGTGTSGAGYTCILQMSGAVQCVGDGGLGQLGQGFFQSSTEALVEVDLRL
jgi:alpha-tubulin suppressor-like RCC1 family protein